MNDYSKSKMVALFMASFAATSLAWQGDLFTAAGIMSAALSSINLKKGT